MTKRWGCCALKSKHITGDSVGQIHSGYEGFFKLNKHTVPLVIELLNDTKININFVYDIVKNRTDNTFLPTCPKSDRKKIVISAVETHVRDVMLLSFFVRKFPQR